MAQRHRVTYFLVLWGILLAGGILIGTVLLLFTSLIPTEAIAPTIRRALPTVEAEGLYPQGPPESEALSSLTVRDNFTDTLYLDIALMEEPGLAGGLSASYWIEGDDPFAWLTGALDEVAGTGTSPTAGDAGTDADAEGGKLVAYPRYWHGFLVYLRPLLATGLPYGAVRLFIGAVVLGLFGASIALFALRRLGYVVPLVLALLLGTAGWLLPFSIQYSNGMLPAAIAVFAVSVNPRFFCEWGHGLPLAMAVGIATAYFDLLTFPLVAIGATVTLLCVIRSGEGLGRDGFLREAAFAASLLLGWACGWASMWVAKWCLASIVLGTDVIGNALGTARMRTGATANNGEEAIGRLDALRRSAGVYVDSPFERIVFLAAFVGYGIWAAIRFALARRAGIVPSTAFVGSLLPYACVAATGILWCLVLDNHTYQHIFMTYRTFAVVPLAVVGWMAGYGASLGRTGGSGVRDRSPRHFAPKGPTAVGPTP